MATMQISVSGKDKGNYGNTLEIEAQDHLKRVSKFLPLHPQEAQGGYAYRLKFEGTGKVVIHEAGFDVGIRGRA